MLSLSRPDVDRTTEYRLSADWIGQPGSIRARRRYRLDQTSAVVGKGSSAFDRGRQAVKQFDMARQGWVDAELLTAPLAIGTPVAVHARFGPLWATSIGIVTALDESASHIALSYGTSKRHVAVGEERFDLVLHDNGDVVFTITAVSRPARWWAWLGYPITRLSQARFRRGAMRTMRSIVRK